MKKTTAEARADRLKTYWNLPAEVEGDWGRRRRLAAALRDLSNRCVTSEGGDLDGALALLEQALTLLPPGPSTRDAFRQGAYLERPGEYTDRVAVFGRCNPTSVPLDLRWEEGEAVCDVVLDDRLGGAPGIAHGGHIAACFDQLCGYCVIMEGRSGLTAELQVRYRRPVPLHVPLRFVGRLDADERRVLRLSGECRRGDVVLAECAAVFVPIDEARARALFGVDDQAG